MSWDLLFAALKGYQHGDPAGWLKPSELWPLPLTFLLGSLGMVLVLSGGGRGLRFSASVAAGLLGVAWGAYVANQCGLHGRDPLVTAVAALALSSAVAFSRRAAAFVLWGATAGVVGGTLLGGQDFLLGFAPFCAVGGALAVLSFEVVTSMFTTVLGGWMFVLGLLALSRWIGIGQDVVRGAPWLAPALAVAIGSSFWALERWVLPPGEEVARRRAARADRERKLREQHALRQRWNGNSGS